MRIIPGVTADTHAHVLTGHAGSKFGLAPAERPSADPAHRAQLAGCGCEACTCTSGRRSSTSARSRESVAPSPRWASSRSTTSAVASAPDTPGPTSRRRSAPTSTRSSAPPANTCRGGAAHHRARTQHGGRGCATTLPRHHRQAGRGHLRGRRRRDGRQPRGGPVRTALRGRARGRFDGASTGEPVTVVGRHCESGDVLVDGIELPDARVSATCWPYRPPARTASRCPTTTTETVGSPWSSRGDGQRSARRAPGDVGTT